MTAENLEEKTQAPRGLGRHGNFRDMKKLLQSIARGLPSGGRHRLGSAGGHARTSEPKSRFERYPQFFKAMFFSCFFFFVGTRKNCFPSWKTLLGEGGLYETPGDRQRAFLGEKWKLPLRGGS